MITTIFVIITIISIFQFIFVLFYYDKFIPTHINIKTGNNYQVLYYDVLHTEEEVNHVIYRNKKGKVFTRPSELFEVKFIKIGE